MLKEVATDLARDELSKLSWRVNVNLSLILFFILFVGTMAVYGWRLLEGLDEHKDFRDDLHEVRADIARVEKIALENSSHYSEIKNLLLWIQSDVLVMKTSIANKAFGNGNAKLVEVQKDPPKIIYQTIVQDKEGKLHAGPAKEINEQN
jgi:hypothetical protein